MSSSSAEPIGALRTERLVLRPLTAEQSRAIAAGQEPPDLRFAAGYPSVDTLEVADLFTGPRSTELPGLVPYVIIRGADDRAIGDIGYTLSPDARTATVGYDINPNDRGKGYATEALRGLTAALFASGVRAVRADTYADHLASRRVMEKAGMTLVSEHVVDDDGSVARVVDYEVRAG